MAAVKHQQSPGLTAGHMTCESSDARFERLTPQSHEDGEEDSGGVVKQVTGPRGSTGGAQFPVAAHLVTQRTHGDVVLRVTDLHASNDTSHRYTPTTSCLPLPSRWGSDSVRTIILHRHTPR